MLFAGIDIGSTITKVVIRDERSIILYTIRPTGAEHRRLAHEVMKDTLEKAGLDFEQIDFIVATGYGRINVPFADAQVSEITCHMRGVSWLFPNVRTVIDIGGQDSKGIKVVDGKVRNFIMNDKCAAGTGRFLEIIADTLFERIDIMLKKADAFIVLPGGTGTLLELSAVLEHLNKGLIDPKPIIMLGDFWKPALTCLKNEPVLSAKTKNKRKIYCCDELVTFVKNVDECIEKL